MFHAYWQFRDTLIAVVANDRQTTPLPPHIEQLANEEFSIHATPVPIQLALKESGIFTVANFSWTRLRDILTDVQFMPAQPHLDNMPTHTTVTTPDAETSPQPPAVSSINSTVEETPAPSSISYRIEGNTTLSRAVRIHLTTNTCEWMPPQLNHSFVLETRQHSYTLVAPNVFMMWSWIRTIRRNYMAYHMMKETREGREGEGIGVGSLYQSYHMPHVEGPDLEASLSGTLSVQLNDQLYACRCSLSGLLMECIDLTNDTRETILLKLHDLQSVILSQDYAEAQAYQLAVNLESGRVSVTTWDDLSRVERGSGVVDTGPNTPLEKKVSKWYPGRAVVKGVQLTSKLVTGVVKGTVQGTTLVVKGTADLATSAATGIVSAAATGLGVVQGEVATFPVLQTPHSRALMSDPVSGIAPYWDKHCLLSVDKFMVGEVLDNSADGDLRPVGALAHLVGIKDKIETVLGSKFLRYEDLIPDDSLSIVKDDTLQSVGGRTSDIAEISFHLDEDVEFIVEVHGGENLLPPPSSESLSTIITHPLQTFVNVSTVAVATIGLTAHASQSHDRSPRITGSVVRHDGRTIDKSRKQRCVIWLYHDSHVECI